MKRIYHTWERWECYPAGFYENKPKEPALTDDQCLRLYAALLRDLDAFRSAMDGVLQDWPNSCEHYLSNERMNRVAWLGQASLCYMLGIPNRYRGGFNLLSEEEQEAANLAALGYLNKWLANRGEPTLTLAEAASKTKNDHY